MNNYFLLRNIAKYSNTRVEARTLTKKNYIGTDNMLQNKQGVVESKYVPTNSSVAEYKKGDILVSNIRPYLKKIWFANQNGGASSDVLIFRVAEGYNKKFVYYSMLQDNFFDYMMSISRGSKMPRSDKELIFDYKIPSFTKEEQDRIDLVLSSLDYQIETNNKIKIELEEMMKTLYDYWFMQFEFPNDEGKPYKSSGGKMVWNEKIKRDIPEGWIVENIMENSLLVPIKSGINKFDGKKTYLTTSDVVDKSINYNAKKITFKDRVSRANMQPVENSVWFAKMKDSKKILGFRDNAYDINNLIISTGMVGLKVNENAYEYILMFIDDTNFEVLKDRLSNGNTQQSINNEDLKSIPLLIPTNEVLDKFHKNLSDIRKSIELKTYQNYELINTLEWLIPLLMSGKLKIKKSL